jgi:putative transposase
MSRKLFNNAIIENFGILKSELFYLKKIHIIDQLKKEINDYVKNI